MIYGRWSKYLTGERKEAYLTNRRVDIVLGIVIGLTVTVLDLTRHLAPRYGLLIIALPIAAITIYRLVQKNTVWQLRCQEIAAGKKEAESILRNIQYTAKDKK